MIPTSSHPVSPAERKRFRRIRLCMLLSGLSVFAQLYLFQPLLSDLCSFYGISAVTGSLSVSASTIGMAVGLFVLAFKADAVSRGRLMGASLIASSLLTLLSVLAFNYPLLLLANFLKGAVLAGVSAVALAYLTEEVDSRQPAAGHDFRAAASRFAPLPSVGCVRQGQAGTDGPSAGRP